MSDRTLVASLSQDDIRRALQQERPGLGAQARMLPQRPRDQDRQPVPGEWREAAVLILVYPVEGVLHLVLTRRTETVQTHKGQISLPGGAHEGQETLIETALREANEEVAISSNGLEILGTLTPLYVGVSNYMITPVVALAPQQPNFRPDPIEVVETIEIPVALLLDPTIRHEEEWEIRDDHVHVPFFAIGANKVWGATAMILSEFAALLEQALAA